MNDPTVLEHGRAVRSMFGRIAQPYDFLNRFFSGGIDLYWRWCLVRQAINSLQETSAPCGVVLDLATGSGDVARMLEKRSIKVLASDFCLPMLTQAQAKGVNTLVAGDALALPFVSHTFAAATVAFGLRNFGDRLAAMREILRTLKPGASLHILEFTRPQEWCCGFYFFYLKYIMPRLASVLCRDGEAYSYLARTVEAFPRAEEIGLQLEKAGYANVTWKCLTLGMVALHSGTKPQAYLK